jgi:hypothetical protein
MGGSPPPPPLSGSADGLSFWRVDRDLKTRPREPTPPSDYIPLSGVVHSGRLSWRRINPLIRYSYPTSYSAPAFTERPGGRRCSGLCEGSGALAGPRLSRRPFVLVWRRWRLDLG